jgi:signal transduction histidine kinase
MFCQTLAWQALSAHLPPKLIRPKLLKLILNQIWKAQRLDNDKEVVVYRAVCELINNSILHSGASRIEIELNKHEKFITLQFYDNGRGFDTSSLSKEDTKGTGLSNIETG